MSKQSNKNFKNFRNNNSNTFSEYEYRKNEYGLCLDCKQPNTNYNWCQNCNSKRFQHDFDKWTSGNKYIDNFIQETQLKARNKIGVIEWIPYNRFRNIQYLSKGGFSTVYKAIWLDGPIEQWDNKAKTWERIIRPLRFDDHEIAKEKDVKSPLNKNEKGGFHVALKSLNNSSNINDDFLNELKIHLLCVSRSSRKSISAVYIYGITQDPETSNYIMVMRFMKEGNLRTNLRNRCDFKRYHSLVYIAKALLTLHKRNLVHGDFHSGNVLLNNIGIHVISDFGLSRPVNKTINTNEIYGVIPYMAPEVLRGKPYTKAADIYSFGIIMWELTSGIPAFNNRPHDFDLSLDICKGLRPETVECTLPVYARLMKRCWDSDPNKRPTADELVEILSIWFDFRNKLYSENRIPVPNNEPITENHPLSCYTSRKIDYSAKLNEILTQEELSTKIVVYEERESKLLSESLENCIISD